MSTKGINLRNRHIGRQVTVYLYGHKDDAVTGTIVRDPRGYKGGSFMNFKVDGLRVATFDLVELAPKTKPVVKLGSELTAEDAGKAVSVNCTKGELAITNKTDWRGVLEMKRTHEIPYSPFANFYMGGTALAKEDVVTFI